MPTPQSWSRRARCALHHAQGLIRVCSLFPVKSSSPSKGPLLVAKVLSPTINPVPTPPALPLFHSWLPSSSHRWHSRTLFHHARMALNVSHRFKSPTQAFGQKFFRLGKEMEPVFWAHEPVALVGVDDVLHGLVRLAQRRYDLIAFSLCNPHIVGALPD